MKVIFTLLISLNFLIMWREVVICSTKEEVINISKHKEEKPSNKPGDGRRDYNV